MSYTRDDYVKDLYIAEHSNDFSEREDAKHRAQLYDRGRIDVIKKGYPEFADSVQVSDYEMQIWSCLTLSRAVDRLFDDGGERDRFISFLMYRYAGFDDFDESERPLIRQIREIAANSYHMEKILYTLPPDKFKTEKEGLDEDQDRLVPLLQEYRERYYTQAHSKGESDGSALGGCALLVIVALIIFIALKSCS
ncbi:hypothetical protein B5F74_02330 [Collinsella sp. An271]|uniref:hypothetical protein n=1 Tax=Collinsella sp. An271 TaxID=1965616 RepID=UPI000B367BC0|nr:hypothetical protein [Collinsella sp. An271]OUO62069.1 hypothetical protein B5F74_02330 [Collinsella sp. An271]